MQAWGTIPDSDTQMRLQATLHRQGTRTSMPADSDMPQPHTVRCTVCHRRSAGQLTRLHGKCRHIRSHDTHQVSRTVAVPGRHVKAHRTTQSRFCGIDCGFQRNADHNATWNILGRCDLPVARGTGAVTRRGALPSDIPMARDQKNM